MNEIMNTEKMKFVIDYLNSQGFDIQSKTSDNYNWRDELQRTKTGNVKATYANHKLVFENAIDGTLKYNEFEHVIEYNGNVLNNATIAMLRNEFEQIGEFRNKDVTRDFVTQYSYQNKYNPIKNYLESLEWDGKQRIATMFIDWFGVDDTSVNRKMAEKWMVSGVKRIYEPGCLIEGMIVLVGAQGVGKSTFIKRLGKMKYSVEAIVDLRNEKNCIETFNRAWIVNFDELKSLIKADSDLAKAVLTRQSDTSRLAYREESETYDRHCIFIGATNDTSILKDYTDKVERRYWTMLCNQNDKRYIYDNFNDDIVDQLWAEAYHIYKHNQNYNISISDFTDAEFDELYNTQRNFKSFNGDNLPNELLEILDGSYKLSEDLTFESADDFVNQALGRKQFDAHTLFNQIEAIPFSYVNHYLRMTQNARQNKYIIEALGDKWREVDKYQYGARRLHCLVRNH